MGWRIGQLTARSIDPITTSVVTLFYGYSFPDIFLVVAKFLFQTDFVPSSVMVPPRRLDELLGQARQYQAQQCRYHVSNLDSSLYHEHYCSRHQFPTTTTHILEGHTDEVWQIQWSHSGTTLASGSKDKTVILWCIVSSPLFPPLTTHSNLIFVSISPKQDIQLTVNVPSNGFYKATTSISAPSRGPLMTQSSSLAPNKRSEYGMYR